LFDELTLIVLLFTHIARIDTKKLSQHFHIDLDFPFHPMRSFGKFILTSRNSPEDSYKAAAKRATAMTNAETDIEK
jgi:hypothetical protein